MPFLSTKRKWGWASFWKKRACVRKVQRKTFYFKSLALLIIIPMRRMIIMKINLVFVSWMLSRWTLYSHHMHIVITVVIKRPQWWDIVCSAIKDNICSLVHRLCPPTLILPSSILLSFIEHGFLICMFSQMNLHWWENVLFVQSGPHISSVLPRPPICLMFSFFICINKIKQIIIREK